MEIGQTTSSINEDIETDYIISNPSILRKNRFRNFFGIPKLIDDEHIDSERCSWCMFVLLKTHIFLYYFNYFSFKYTSMC